MSKYKSKYKTSSDSAQHKGAPSKKSASMAGRDLATRKASGKVLRQSSERFSEAMKRLAKR